MARMVLFLILLITNYSFLSQKLPPTLEQCQLNNRCKNAQFTSTKNELNLPPCYCQNENCWLYDDCCADVDPKLETIENPQIQCKTFSEDKSYVIDSCPINWLDDNIRSLCLKEVDIGNYHYVLDLPFQSNKTKILYSNVYCAFCNEDNSTNALKFQIGCTEKNCSIGIINDLIYQHGNLSWFNPRSNLKMTVEISGKDLRPCLADDEIIKTCADDWNDTNVSNQCGNYTNYVQSWAYEITFYKNIHCAICNYVNISDIYCEVHSPQDIRTDSTMTYAKLLDFSPEKHCSYDQVMIDSDVCVTFLCGKNFIPKNGDCIAIANNNDTISNATMDCPSALVSIDSLTFLPNGSVIENDTERLYNVNEYQRVNETTYLVCLRLYDYNESGNAERVLSAICVFISLVCLAGHVTAHYIIGSYKKLPEKNLMNFSCALFLAQLFYFVGSYVNFVKSVCYVISVMSHYLFLVVFFWMNVMAFDICLTMSKSQQRSNSKKTFCYYMIYSWFIPLLIIVLSICVDQNDILPHFKPQYGLKICWIHGKKALVVFFIVPIAIILIENVFFYFFTIYVIYKTKKLTRCVTKGNDSNQFSLNVKLAFVMGGTWILGFIWIFTNIETLKYIYTIFNSSQGTFVFLVFTFKNRIWRKLRDKLSRKKITSVTIKSSDASSTTKFLNLTETSDRTKIM